jgi:hypothetical protein
MDFFTVPTVTFSVLLLTDLFLLSEIANTQRRAAKPMASGG